MCVCVCEKREEGSGLCIVVTCTSVLYPLTMSVTNHFFADVQGALI